MLREGETSSHEAAEDALPVASANRLPITVNVPSSVRHSMDEYYHQPTTPVEPQEAPPSYDDFLDSPALRRRFNIQPREDEGRETLPPYSTAISLENVFLRKMELEGAVHQATDRSWTRVMVTLQGTALTFHKCKTAGVFGAMGGKKHSPDLPAGTSRGAFLRSYNLQHADVGIAADYLKKRYVIRVRAETEQFLLSCHKIETFVLWLQSLFAAIDLAPPLDDREIPQDLSIPRRVRRRNRAGITNIERNDQLVREQEEIMRTHFPNLADSVEGSIAEEAEDQVDGESIAEAESIIEGEAEDDDSSSSFTPTPALTRSPTFSSPSQASILASSSASPPSFFDRTAHTRPSTSTPQTTSLLMRTRQRMVTSSTSSHAAPATNPSISADGKWAPQHQWTHFYDMMYAKRCMAILTHRSPRKSNLVIMKGKQWIVDWTSGKLTRVSPPEYGEVTAETTGKAVQSEVRVRSAGEGIRA